MKKRFFQLFREMDLKVYSRGEWDKVVKDYDSPHKEYHNLSHIGNCLSEFGCAQRFLKDPNAVELAIFYHDCVYEPKNFWEPSNEELSSRKVYDVLIKGGKDEEFASKVQDLVRDTTHKETPRDDDSKYLCDIDLSILGKSKDIFEGYETAIRLEYSFVPQEIFEMNRKKVLENFLKRDNIYYTEFFHKKYELNARENLERSIKGLI